MVNLPCPPNPHTITIFKCHNVTSRDSFTCWPSMAIYPFAIQGHYSFFLYELHRADNSLHGKRNLITMKTETTIIRIDEDDAMRDKDDDDPPISIPFCNWYLIYDERFKERSAILNKIEGHGLLVRTDRYDVRDNWPILILFSRDHIGLSFFRIKVNLWWITSTKTDCT